MGAVQLGGMTLSTLFTLVLVPTMFSLWLDVQAGVRTWFGRQPKVVREAETMELEEQEHLEAPTPGD
jgi:hypothetical protein